MFRGRRVPSHELYSTASFCPLSAAECLTQFVAQYCSLLAIDWLEDRPHLKSSSSRANARDLSIGQCDYRRLRGSSVRAGLALSARLGMTNLERTPWPLRSLREQSASPN